MNNVNVHFQSTSTEWNTPQIVFDTLHAIYSFTLDPAATENNAKCKKFFTRKENGLIQSWSNERVFCNPPYGREISKWVQKMDHSEAKVVAALLPARTDTLWFHQYILGKATIRFIRGRLKFSDIINPAPFPSMICVWDKRLPDSY